MSAPKACRAAWCHGDMTCTCGETVAHQDVIDAMNSDGLARRIYEAESEQIIRPYRWNLHLVASALRDILATLGDTAIVPPHQLAAARAALTRVKA